MKTYGVKSMNETVLVTGGTGFVAGWCIVELLRRGYSVRTTLRSASAEVEVRAAVATAVDSAQDRLHFCVADLTQDEGWAAAMTGCDHVLHVASPLGNEGPGTSMVEPARDGTLRVLRAAAQAGVRKVVMTSSCAAAAPLLQGPDSVNDESQWTDERDPDLNNYRLSKLHAERAAWDFIEKNSDGMSLTTILPSAIFGPVLSRKKLGSVQIIERMIEGRMRALPHVGMCIVDVRDLAELHVDALESNASSGQRFIAAGEFMWMSEMAQALRSGLGEAGRKVSTRRMPDFMLRLAARLVPALHNLVPILGRKHVYVSTKAQALLGFRPRPAVDTLLDCARSLQA